MTQVLTQEENDLLTRTNPGTPAGKMLRSYWQPAALSEELPEGGAPLPLRLFGEDPPGLIRDPRVNQVDPIFLKRNAPPNDAELETAVAATGGRWVKALT